MERKNLFSEKFNVGIVLSPLGPVKVILVKYGAAFGEKLAILDEPLIFNIDKFGTVSKGNFLGIILPKSGNATIPCAP
jgi:hypothetical protein